MMQQKIIAFGDGWEMGTKWTQNENSRLPNLSVSLRSPAPLLGEPYMRPSGANQPPLQGRWHGVAVTDKQRTAFEGAQRRANVCESLSPKRGFRFGRGWAIRMHL